MSEKLRRGPAMWVAVAAALALCLAQAEARTRQPSEIRVGPGSLSGTVTDSLGKTLPGVGLRVSRGEEVLIETRTGKDGRYVLESLVPGEYELHVGDWEAMALTVEDGETAHTLQVVVPAEGRYSAAALTRTQWIWIGVGITAAAVVAVAVPIAVSGGGGGGGHKTVSP